MLPFARIFAAAAILTAPITAQAALNVGAKAPTFDTKAAIAGKDFSFSLASALKKGPVVLYFFPAAFTAGCTIEAHAFAEATEEFNKLGATVVGMTAGNIDRINEFSKVECRDKFAVGVATPAMIEKYDVKLAGKPGWTDRTSYVIAPNGKIIFVHSDRSPAEHITMSMDAVKTWKAKH